VHEIASGSSGSWWPSTHLEPLAEAEPLREASEPQGRGAVAGPENDDPPRALRGKLATGREARQRSLDLRKIAGQKKAQPRRAGRRRGADRRAVTGVEGGEVAHLRHERSPDAIVGAENPPRDAVDHLEPCGLERGNGRAHHRGPG
jgi:hypothetical protein